MKKKTKHPDRKISTQHPEPNLRRAVDLVMALLAIPGRSGEEGAILEAIRSRLLAAGLSADDIIAEPPPRKSHIAGKAGNLIVRLPGTLRAPRRLFSAHVDTVPICVGAKPVLKGRHIHSADPNTGLGGDDRSGAAVLLCTALEILTRRLPHPPLTFLWTVQEEVGLYGARFVRRASLGKPSLAFNYDGGATNKVTIGATGGYRMHIEIEGLASHAGGAPEEGISAIAIAALAIADLVNDGWHGKIEKNGSSGTSNVGVIEGGAATNVVTDRVSIRAEARSHDKRFRAKIIREIERALARAAKSVRNAAGKCGKVAIDGRLDYEAFRLDPNEPSVRAAADAVGSLGMKPELSIANGGLDANWLTAHGIPTVTLGCGQMDIHTVRERLDVAEYEKACQIALRLATDVK